MQSISVSQPDSPTVFASKTVSPDTRLPPDVTWQDVFTLRNTVALRTHEKFGCLIPVEEFLSAGNEAIVDALRSFAPAKGAAFPSFLYLVLARKMRKVIEHEWAGTIQRTYTGSKHTHRTASLTYRPPRFTPLRDDTCHAEGTQEQRVLLAEITRFVATAIAPANGRFLLEWLDGATPTELQHRYGPHYQSIMNRIRKTRQRVAAWAAAAPVAA